MHFAIDRLVALRVCDVMSSPVVCVSEKDSMSHAAALMLANNVSGTPVINDLTRCIGMLSAIDFLRRETRKGNQHAQAPHDESTQLASNVAGCDLVADHMSTGLKSIGVDESLAKAAQVMCRAHVHRLPALSSEDKVVGIVSALDIVAALVNAVEEAKM